MTDEKELSDEENGYVEAAVTQRRGNPHLRIKFGFQLKMSSG